MTPSPQVTPKEWRWAASWSIVILLLSCIPYIVAALAAPEGWQFAGILVNPMDGQSYLAKMQQGVDGNWLFHLTFTPEPHQGAFIFTFYLALGHLAALTGLSKILIFHLARLLAGFGLLWVAFGFIARITPVPAERRLVFIFVFSASGLGWLGVIFGTFPIDLWVPEAFVPYSLYANPHFPLAMMLMLIIFGQIISVSSLEFQLSEAEPAQHSYALLLTPYSLFWTGLSALALAMILPFALLTVWAILAVFLAWLFITRRRLPWAQIWPTLGAVILAAPVILYQYWVSITNPILAGWSAQNVTPAPKILDFGLGYGLVGLLALLGIWIIIRQGRSSPEEWLVLLWAVATVVLIYIPFDLQRRMITGLHLPLCILAAIGLNRWPINRHRFRRLMTLAAVTLGALGTLVVWGLPLVGMQQSPTESATTALFFMRQDESTALAWLQQHAEPTDVILASPRLGLFVPGQTGARAFYGHPFETIEAREKRAQAETFFRGEIEAVPAPVDYVIYGPSEQALGRPEVLTGLPVVFSVDEVTIYWTLTK